MGASVQIYAALAATSRSETGPEAVAAARFLFGGHGRDLALGGAVDASVGPTPFPAVQISLGFFEALEAQALQGRLFCVAHTVLDSALVVRLGDST